MNKETIKLNQQLSNTFGMNTLAHDIIKGKEPSADELEALASSYIELREIAWSVVTQGKTI